MALIPIFEAIQRDDLPHVQRLLKEDPQLLSITGENDAWNVVIHASSYGALRCLKHLLDTYDEELDINYSDGGGRTALHWVRGEIDLALYISLQLCTTPCPLCSLYVIYVTLPLIQTGM